MLSRSVAILLAIFLFWSGLAPQEPGLKAASLTVPHGESSAIVALPGQSGSDALEHHAVDDPPAQAQVEAGSDVPALMPYIAGAPVPNLAMGRPAAHRAAAWVAPTLDGLRRPPRRLSAAA